MRFVVVILLSLGLLLHVVADDEVNDQDRLNQGIGNSPDDDVSTVLPDIENYESQDYYGEKQINSYSGWGNDESEFSLYNPRFEEHYENSGSGSGRDYIY